MQGLDTSQFFVVHTQPNCEKRALDDLTRQSFSTYCPMTLCERRHARRRDFVPRPFFPRYMFVLDDGRGVSDIKRTRGVNDVVRRGLEPARVGQRVIDDIKAREEDGFIKLREVSSAFRYGELLRVTDGAYEGYNALFQKMRGEVRALVFLTLVIDGRAARCLPAEVPVADLERAA